MDWQAALQKMDEAILTTLNDGLCTYLGSGAPVEDLGYLLERDVELYDGDGVAQVVTTISLSSPAIGAPSRQGDLIVTPDRTWTVQQTLSDDGSMRQLSVT